MASDTQRKTILLKGDFDGNHAVEGQAHNPITPGMLIDYDGDEKILRVFNRASNVTGIQPMFAVEDDVVGQVPNVGMAIDQVYADGDRTYGYICQKGDQVYALCDSGGDAIVFGDLLESAGAGTGTLVKRNAGTTIARALEAVDNSGGSNAARIKVEIV